MSDIPILPLVLYGQIQVLNEVKIVDYTNPLEDIKIECVFEEKHAHSTFVTIGKTSTANLYQNFFS